MVGSFEIGLVSELQPAAGAAASTDLQPRYHDGSETYMQNTQTDVDRMRSWVTQGMASSPLVPAPLRPDWPKSVTFSPGVYDFPGAYHGKGPGTPQMWENDLTISMRGGDAHGLVWAYSERFDWFGLGKHATGKEPVPFEWIAATARARAAAGRRAIVEGEAASRP